MQHGWIVLDPNIDLGLRRAERLKLRPSEQRNLQKPSDWQQ